MPNDHRILKDAENVLVKYTARDFCEALADTCEGRRAAALEKGDKRTARAYRRAARALFNACRFMDV